jgi:biotin transport system substrate-specific component
MLMTTATDVLVDRLWPRNETAGWLRAALLAVAGSALVAVSAQISVPMLPVPMTLQTFAVLLIGLAYGARLGAATLLLYLVEGLALPVFQEFATWWHPKIPYTAGYLIGFVVAAAVVGWLADRGWSKSIAWSIAAALIGSVVIYAAGAPWLATLIGWDAAIAGGVLPFVLGDAIKAVLAALCLPVAWQFLGRTR